MADTGSPFSGKQRAELRAEAHHIQPTVHVGHQGLTPAVIDSLDDALAWRASSGLRPQGPSWLFGNGIRVASTGTSPRGRAGTMSQIVPGCLTFSGAPARTCQNLPSMGGRELEERTQSGGGLSGVNRS